MIGCVLGAQGVAGGGVLQAHDGDDVARGHGVDVDALVGVHLQQTADALLLALRGVQHVAAGVQMAGVHAQVGELAHVGVGHDLEGQSEENGAFGSAGRSSSSPVSGFTPLIGGMSTGDGM